MPAARPSMPSMKLTALMVMTTSRMVNVTLRSGSSEKICPFGVGSHGSDSPLHTRMPAAATCPASWLMALSPHRSSMKPTTASSPPASSSPSWVREPAAWNGDCMNGSRLATSKPATRPPYIASPPSRGVGSVWTSRSLGLAIAPVVTATRRASGTSRNVTAAVTSITRAYSRIAASLPRGRWRGGWSGLAGRRRERPVSDRERPAGDRERPVSHRVREGLFLDVGRRSWDFGSGSDDGRHLAQPVDRDRALAQHPRDHAGQVDDRRRQDVRARAAVQVHRYRLAKLLLRLRTGRGRRQAVPVRAGHRHRTGLLQHL